MDYIFEAVGNNPLQRFSVNMTKDREQSTKVKD